MLHIVLWSLFLTHIIPVSAILLTPSLLALGSYEGKVYVYKTTSLVDSTSEVAASLEPIILRAHKNKVYDLYSIRGVVSTNGHTSLFPTYIGHAAKDVQKEFLVSIGSGRCYPSLNGAKAFKKFICQKGSYVNVWLL